MINIQMDRKNQKVLVKIAKIDKSMHEGMRLGFIEMGKNLVRQTENKILSEPKQGKVYKNIRLKNGDVVSEHTSSAPGQTPALLSGEYHDELDYIPNGWQGLQFINEAPHAEYLELGTKNMLPRPGMRNAIVDNLKSNRKYLETNIEKEINK